MSANNTLLAFVWGKTSSATSVFIRDWDTSLASYDEKWFSLDSTTGVLTSRKAFSAKIHYFARGTEVGGTYSATAYFQVYMNGTAVFSTRNASYSGASDYFGTTISVAVGDTFDMSCYANNPTQNGKQVECGFFIENVSS